MQRTAVAASPRSRSRLERPPRTRRGQASHGRARSLRSAAALLTLAAAPLEAAAQSTARTWQRWEHTLVASQSYAYPYLDHVLDVTFTGPQGRVHHARGFWDGGDVFRIRFMFPVAGWWRWSTTFSNPWDGGLHGRSGFVGVTASSGSNPLYTQGGLVTGPSGRRLLHADGTPFVMLGDQAWLAYLRATDEEWVDYVDHRVAHGFNAIIISVGSTDQGSRNAEGEGPFSGSGDAEEWNPEFWRNVDEMIQVANDRGVVIVACGLAISSRFENAEQSLAFSRSFAARVAGNHVILSTRQDWGDIGPASADDTALEAAGSAPLQLQTQHLDRRPMPEHGLDFHAESYLDFSGVQTNKGEPGDEAPTTLEEASRAQIEWVDALYQASPAKPVVVLEGIHENEVDQTLLRREILRRQAYLSFTGGAVGFVTSAFGVWTWGEGAGFRPEWGEQSLEDALELPYNGYIAHLRAFLDAVDVTALLPYAEEEIVLNQADDFEHTMLMVMRADGALAIAYLPDNAAIVLDMGAFPTPMKAYWFRTTTGSFAVAPDPVPNDAGPQTLAKPSGWGDAVLILQAMPEPGGTVGVVSGGALVALLARRAGRRARTTGRSATG